MAYPVFNTAAVWDSEMKEQSFHLRGNLPIKRWIRNAPGCNAKGCVEAEEKVGPWLCVVAKPTDSHGRDNKAVINST